MTKGPPTWTVSFELPEDPTAFQRCTRTLLDEGVTILGVNVDHAPGHWTTQILTTEPSKARDVLEALQIEGQISKAREGLVDRMDRWGGNALRRVEGLARRLREQMR